MLKVLKIIRVSIFLDLSIRTTTDESSTLHKKNADLPLLSTMIDLFLAGTETTSSTLLWGIYFMVDRPEIQDRVQKELNGVMGDRLLAR